MTVIIGSAAAKHWFPDFPREPNDVDSFDRVPTGEAGNYDIFWHPLLMEWFDTFYVNHCRFATPDELYTIKVSHAYWELKNGSWDKHIFDMLWLKNKGAVLLEDLHNTLYKVWEETHGKKKMDLSKEADEFFKDAVKRTYDHDSIHYSVAFEPGKPIYEKILKDGHSVDVDPKKLWVLPFDEQVKLFREEVAATALERLMIPNNYKFSAGRAWHWALRRTITSLTKGKSARFIVENFEHFSKVDNYLERHLENKRFLIPLEVKV